MGVVKESRRTDNAELPIIGPPLQFNLIGHLIVARPTPEDGQDVKRWPKLKSGWCQWVDASILRLFAN